MAVTLTLILYWGMVECCLGLFAACLPAVPFLFRGFSPESLIASIRSVLSLHSLHSRGSREERSAPASASKRYNARDDSSMGSHTGIVAHKQENDVSLEQYYATNQHGNETV